jgi:L-aminopeptidase/D-esterase-like protein
VPETADFSALCALAAEVVSLAIRNGVLAARAVSATEPAPGVPAAEDLSANC